MRTFCDLSHLNPITSLTALKNTSISGVVLKGQQGVTYQDPMYSKRVQEFKDAGIPILAEYLYYVPGDDPAKQAQNVIDNCQDEKTVAIDLEWMKGSEPWAGDQDQNNDDLNHCITALEAAGFEIKIYTSHAFIVQNLPAAVWLGLYDLWVAWYRSAPPLLPPMWKTWWAWQYTATASLPGVSGYVDLSYLNDGAA